MRTLDKLALRNWPLPHADDASDKEDRSLALLMPQACFVALPETPAGGLQPSGADRLQECAVRSSAVLIDPGLLDGGGSC